MSVQYIYKLLVHYYYAIIKYYCLNVTIAKFAIKLLRSRWIQLFSFFGLNGKCMYREREREHCRDTIQWNENFHGTD